MKKTLYLIIILSFFFSLSDIILARDVTEVNWPSSNTAGDIKKTSEEKELYTTESILSTSAPSFSADLFGSGVKPGEDLFTKRIILELNEEVKKEDIDTLTNMGCKIEVYIFNLVQILVPCNKIDSLKKLNFVRYLRLPSDINNDSKIINEIPSLEVEDFSSINLKGAHKNGYLGQGIKIAILDTGFDPENPLFKKNIFYTLSFRSQDGNIKAGDTEHGNAVTEITTRVAPKAKIILANFQTDVEYIKALTKLINQPETLKPNVILTTVNLILPDDYYDGTGLRASFASFAKKKGITLVSSAGNNAQTHYKGNFSDTNHNHLHNFTPKDDTLEIELKKGDKIRVVLAWKDNWKEPSQDVDVGIFDDSLEPIKISDTRKLSLKAPPYETLEITAPYSGTYHIAVKEIKAYEGLPFMIYVYSGSVQNMEYFTPETSLDPGLPTASDGITVGAVESLEPYKVEPWSSQGKTTDNRLKPDIVAPGGIYCISKQGIFYGTSSAAPQAAGAIALLLSKNPKLSPDELKAILKKTARDLGPPGEDPIFGAGLINISNAIHFF